MLQRGDNPVADSEIVCKSDTAHTELRIEWHHARVRQGDVWALTKQGATQDANDI